jgi:lysophospholipase L1-like esterase
MKLSRRNFIRNSAAQAAGIAGIPLILSATLPAGKSKKAGKLLKQNGVVLFQGDSITDAGRNRTEQKPNHAGSFGGGYALMAAAGLLADYPEKNLTIYNRGISGNKVYQLNDRWKEDCLYLKPDILSILIGVNDYWHKRNGNYDGTVDVYERDYRALLNRTREALPGVKLVICEPFSVDGGSAIGAGWQDEFGPYRKVAKALSQEFDTLFIPYHTIFTEALKYAPAAYWSPDGVHPSMAGAMLMANAWKDVVC